jgi:BirA family transcriptional regulator, biotin operon repressor / biotin---[acetyl-CoA-carboxylase] ligase
VISLPHELSLRLRLQHEASVASTNGVLMQAASGGVEAGLVLLADVQTHGRGRQGRSWLAPPGSGLTFSVLRRPPVSAAESVRWTLLTGVAVIAAIQGVLPQCWLKWPNDIMAGNRKLGGILCERCAEGGGFADALIVGVGLNLRPPPEGWSEDLADRATSIQELSEGYVDSTLRRGPLLVSILEHFVRLEDELLQAGPAALMERYRQALSPLIGREVMVQRAGQDRLVRVKGVQDSGALEVVDDAGEGWAVVAGDVHLGSL